MSQIGVGGENLKSGFLMRSDMSLTLDLETWVKIIPHILTKGTM